MTTQWSMPDYEIPRDEEDADFVKSFHFDEVDEIQKFFDHFGFVVVRDVLSSQECQETIDDIWTYIESKAWQRGLPNKLETPISRNDSNTWVATNWPPLAEEGILGYPPVFTRVALRNRGHENVYKVFRSLLKRDDLLVNHDRYGLFRPTVDVPKGIHDTEIEFYNQDDWKTIRNIHFDMNPWDFVHNTSPERSQKELNSLQYNLMSDFIAENNQVGVAAHYQLQTQALINLADNRKRDGGFQLVPGFHRHLEDWVKNSRHAIKYGEQIGRLTTFIVLPPDNPLYAKAVRITMRAGSMCIWDQRTVHGSAPNASSNFRYAQFLKVFPASPMDEGRRQRRTTAVLQKLLALKIDPQTDLTDTQKKMFGLIPYDENENTESLSNQ